MLLNASAGGDRGRTGRCDAIRGRVCVGGGRINRSGSRDGDRGYAGEEHREHCQAKSHFFHGICFGLHINKEAIHGGNGADIVSFREAPDESA
ncbi:hypothetical protein EMIT0111MI5_30223 [Burkholderia sp. IT-111MI5]